MEKRIFVRYSTVSLLILLLLLIPGCLKLGKPDLKHFSTKQSAADVSKPLNFGSVDSFEETYEGITMIDEKYNINFQQEALFGLMVKEEYIPLIKTDLDNLRKKLDPTGTEKSESFFNISPRDRTEKQLGLLFIDARKKMIESQEQFHRGYSFGVQGLVGDGFYCREEPLITQSFEAFNLSAITAADAKYYFDELLTGSDAITWNLIGVGDKKPVFYFSPLELMWAQLKINRIILHEYCHDERRLQGKPSDKVFVDFTGSKNSDLFISPRRIVTPKVWKILTAPIQSSTPLVASGKAKTTEIEAS